MGHGKVGSAHLGDDGEVLAQVVEANHRYIHLVDDDRPSSSLQHPEEAVGEGGFSSPSPAHNPNLWKQLLRPADRVEGNRADALFLALVGLPALHLQSPSPRLSPWVPAPQLESPGDMPPHHPSPAHRPKAKKTEKTLTPCHYGKGAVRTDAEVLTFSVLPILQVIP